MAGETEDIEDDEDDEDDMTLSADESAEHSAEESDEDLETFVEDGDIDDATPLDPKERAARSLEIRRAIEARQEARKIRRELDYLDDEPDDE